MLSLSVGGDALAINNLRFCPRWSATPKSHGTFRSKCSEVALSVSRKKMEGVDRCDSGERDTDGSEFENVGSERRQQKHSNDNDAKLLLEYSIDSFLRGDYDRTFAEDAASPLPGLSPGDTVDAALRSLRNLDKPEPSHGAAVLLRFCVELGRGERWGTEHNGNISDETPGEATQNMPRRRNKSRGDTLKFSSTWKELLRGALTPTMLARRLRASEEFSGLLDWVELEVSEDAVNDTRRNEDNNILRNGNVAFVSAALYFDCNNDGKSPPELYQFKLAKMLGGVWLIDSVQQSSSGLFRQQIPSKASLPQSRVRTKANGRDKGRQPRQPEQREKPKRRQGKKKLGESNDNEKKPNKNRKNED